MPDITLDYVDSMTILLALIKEFKRNCQTLDLDDLSHDDEKERLRDLCDFANLILKIADVRDHLECPE